MDIPSYNDLYTSILTDLRNRLEIRFIFGKVVLMAFAAVQAAKLKLLYLTAAFVYKNSLPYTADSTELGGTLERFGLLKLGRLPFAAVAGEYTIDVTGEIGAIIVSGTTWKSLDTSASPDKLFVVDTQFTFTGTTGQISIRALEPGIDSSLEVGDQLQLTAPIANVDSFADVYEITVTPVSEEELEDYREKVIEAYRSEPQGGARVDYRIWAADAEGVRTVYPYVLDGAAGELNIYVETFPEDSLDGNGTPSAAILADTEAVIELDPDDSKPMEERGRRPIGIFDIHYYAINAIPVDVIIYDLSDDSYLTAIQEAILDFLYNVRPFIDGADNPQESQKNKLYASDIIQIVRNVITQANTFTNVEVYVDSVLYNIYAFENGDIPFINSVTDA
jgi:hypothetical protein